LNGESFIGASYPLYAGRRFWGRWAVWNYDIYSGYRIRFSNRCIRLDYIQTESSWLCMSITLLMYHPWSDVRRRLIIALQFVRCEDEFMLRSIPCSTCICFDVKNSPMYELNNHPVGSGTYNSFLVRFALTFHTWEGGMLVFLPRKSTRGLV
jgi:hypothetical protein